MKKRFKILVLFILLVITVSALSATVYAASTDYSRPGTTNLTTLDSTEILKQLFDIELSEAEENYLKLHGDYELTYGSHISTSYVTVAYSEETAELAVAAKEYTYTATGGINVTWVPISVSVGDRKADFLKNGTEYNAVFNDVEYNEHLKADVKYSTEFALSAAIINVLLNKAHNDAQSWKDEIAKKEAQYEKMLLEYYERKEKYSEYLEALENYKAELALYETYLVNNRVFLEKLEEYQNYLAELEEYELLYAQFTEYEEAMKQYNLDYAEYQKYLSEKEAYPGKLELYNNYVEKCEKIKLQLSYIDGTKVYSSSLSRSVYSAVFGDTVTMVVANKDAIANNTVGVPPELVDMANDSTNSLRELYNDYFSYEGEADKYAYYSVNYEKFRDCFVNLFVSLAKMYENPKVRYAIGEYGIKDKFEVLLAQLYYVATAISDSPVKKYGENAYYGSTYVINTLTGATALSLLDNVPYMSDTDSATPIEGGYPTSVEKPELVEVEEPTLPELVNKPTEPDEVENPGDAPEELSKPTMPEEVITPGYEPLPYVPPTEVVELINAYDAEKIPYRQPVSSSKNINVQIDVSKKIFDAEICTVIFRDESGNIITTVEADKGTYAEYVGKTPEKAEDDAATYTFIGWMDSRGNAVDISSVNQSVDLYPMFNAEYKSYRVIWNINGVLHSQSVLYGEIPDFGEIPVKPDSFNVEYSFSGWNKPITPVTADVMYVATFTPTYIVKLSNGNGALLSYDEDGNATVDLEKSYDRSVNISGLLQRLASKGALTVKSKQFTAEFSFADVMAMQKAGVHTISFNSVKTGTYGYKITFDFLDESGEKIEASLRAKLSVPCSINDLAALQLYYTEGDEQVSVKYTYSEGVLSFTRAADFEYRAISEYSVNLLATGPIVLTASAKIAHEGDSINVYTAVPKGVVLDGVYIVGADGEKTYLEEKSFTMPCGVVSIGVDYHYLVYTVTFMAENRVISSTEYHYADEVAVPTPPSKASDANYTYSFLGWSMPVDIVTSDATYTAVYSATPIPPKPPQEGLQITDGVMNVIVTVLVVAIYAAVVFLPCLIITVVKIVIRCKRKAPKKCREK